MIFWYYSGHGYFTDDISLDETALGSKAFDDYDETIGLSNYSNQITDDDFALVFNTLSSPGQSGCWEQVCLDLLV